MLNQMSIIGLVSIPGMMTGQILGGTQPALAARYQAVIMFLVMASTSTGAGMACLLGISAVTDAQVGRVGPPRRSASGRLP